MTEYGNEITYGLNSEAITERMNALQLTTADLGDLLGSLLGRKGGAFSPWTVSTWLAGKSLPDGLTLCAIAHLLDLDGSGVITRKLSPKERRAKELRAELEELDAARVRLLREMDATK